MKKYISEEINKPDFIIGFLIFLGLQYFNVVSNKIDMNDWFILKNGEYFHINEIFEKYCKLYGIEDKSQIFHYTIYEIAMMNQPKYKVFKFVDYVLNEYNISKENEILVCSKNMKKYTIEQIFLKFNKLKNATV
jgi:hypothetical protein